MATRRYSALQRLVAMLTCALVLVAIGTSVSRQAKSAQKSDAAIRKEIIAASIAAYRGNCPCPYSTDRRGARCGRRSAYDRPGGRSPLCYERDVTDKMVEDYRKRARR